jgi:pyruvate/2-oxoglutarate dehydrogenase complex dihydrolipoamide acyltransferase (E2) component
MEEGTILNWRKPVGATVAAEEILFEMETDKVVVEVAAPVSGVLLRVDVPEGLVKVGQTVAWLAAAGQDVTASSGASEVPRQHTQSETARAATPRSVLTPAERKATLASPAARRRSRELNIDLRSVQGTGPGGRITEDDVDRAASQQ